MRRACTVILGSRDDIHVERVLARCRTESTLVVDGATLSKAGVTLDATELVVDDGTDLWFVPVEWPARAWVRRLAPEAWSFGVVAGSEEAAEHGAWLSLLGAFGRAPHLRWLSALDDTLVAENKFHQLLVAKSVGVAVPETVVSNRTADVLARLGGARVVKTLGPSYFVNGEEARVVFTQAIDDDRMQAIDQGVPLVFQEQLEAREHLRVVVVGDRVWAGSLDAEGRPLDWRTDLDAHSAFVPADLSVEVETGALRVARALRLGYASQDWILTDDGPFLVDVNPAGQWLFLPEPIADEVTQAIALWLRGEDD